MAVEGPSKQDLTTVFKRLRSTPTNKVFHISFVRSTQLDTSWTWLQLRAMQCGGNANATAFFRQHNCSTTDAQEKYKSRAAVLYREKLHNIAAAAMRSYGNELHLDSGHNEPVSSPTKKEVDFFQEHSEAALFSSHIQISDSSQLVQNGNLANNGNNNSEEGPNVEAVLSTSPTQAMKTQEIRKSTIGNRKPQQSKKSSLAAKKGLGAQRVKKDFCEIEKEAQLADQRREEYESNKKIEQKVTEEDAVKQMASVRLAYKDLSDEREKQEQKMKKADPKKAEQFERLGMGFGGRSKTSHSMASDMENIIQEIPTTKPSKKIIDRFERRDSLEDEFEFLGRLNSGSSKFSDNDFLMAKEESYSSYKSESKSYSVDDTDSRRPKKKNTPSVNNSDTAQKKFGNVKAISSDQYFGDSRDNVYERQANLAKFQGSSSISSADYFGEPQKNANKNYDFNAPNLTDIKDGVKDGVNKVAGRLSNIASGVMSSFQKPIVLYIKSSVVIAFVMVAVYCMNYQDLENL
ncbi:ADP-ribosylation factor GTPase-activating protein 2 [Nymphon striatum]|nr:ADP-ribosylation factor GTPase-activating protein 2 [Nymphon striatum]